jgi:hypothetical protein
MRRGRSVSVFIVGAERRHFYDNALNRINPVTCNQYDVSVFVMHPIITLGMETMPIIECQALGGGIQALLGRDFLGLCLFVYDGQAQRFSFGI